MACTKSLEEDYKMSSKPLSESNGLSNLLKKDMDFIFFDGKGGVGKTTCAAATAVHIAKAKPDKKILIFSADPAHSLSDSFGCHIGEKVSPIKGFDNLYGLEMNAAEQHDDFRKQNIIEMVKIAYRATNFSKKELLNLYGMSYPSHPSFMTTMKFVELIKSGEYDLIIVDTAPTGHTIELLGFPNKMKDQIDVMEKSQEQHRYVRSRLSRRRYMKDKTDRFMEQMIKDIKIIRSAFVSEATEFVTVTIPEAMGVYETNRLLTALEKLKIPVNYVVINRISLWPGCNFCESRLKTQEKYVKEIKEKFPDYELIKMPLFPHEVQGIDDLIKFGEVLFGKPYEYPKLRATKSVFKEDYVAKGKTPDFLKKKKLQIILFGGKGGVGKTTCAAATATYIAKTRPDKKVLVFSIDPAHSLSDSYDFQIGGDEVVSVKNFDNLYALEVDKERVLRDFEMQYVKYINEGFDAFSRKVSRGGGIVGSAVRTENPFARQTLSNLISVAPFGLDELMALSRITEFIQNKTYDLIVIDTAPTGHLVSLLQRPTLVMDWFANTLKGLMNYGDMIINNAFDLLLDMRKKIEETQSALLDPEKTEFVSVMIPEAMSISETEKLLLDFNNLSIPAKNVIVNMITPLNGCSFCSSRRKEEEKYIKKIKVKFPTYAITEMPLFAHEIRGVDDLIDFADVMYRREN